jgi:hypothetical protein
MSEESREQDLPWTSARFTKEREVQLVGNREGFRLLRSKIDEVIETGFVRCNGQQFDWIEMQLVADRPKPEKRKRKSWEVVGLLVAGVVATLIILIFVVGISEVWSWILK